MKFLRVETPEQIGRVAAYLDRFCPDTPQTVTIVPYKPSKTEGQLAKLHAIIRDFSKSQDRNEEDMKVILKEYLGYWEPVERKNGEILHKYLSFADASREQCSEFIDRLKALAIEYHVHLREP